MTRHAETPSREPTLSVLILPPGGRIGPDRATRGIDWWTACFWVFASFNVVAFWALIGSLCVSRHAWCVNILITVAVVWPVFAATALVFHLRKKQRKSALA